MRRFLARVISSADGGVSAKADRWATSSRRADSTCLGWATTWAARKGLGPGMGGSRFTRLSP